MKKEKIKIGIIGCGTIGSEIAKAVDRDFQPQAVLIALSDLDQSKAQALKKKLTGKPLVLDTDSLIGKSDLVIEAASAGVSNEIAKKGASLKKDVMIMSVGGIIRHYEALFNLAAKAGSRIYLPSGAICGLDGVKAAAIGKISKAELTTRKPPASLAGAPFIEKNKINLNGITSETIIFEGSALEAIEGFPANINVSCVLSIAGLGPQKTLVKIITSPEYKRNTHEVILEGEAGRIFTRTENVPSPSNPKTSHLAILSAIATLKQILGPAKVGT
jgi:aspartate dehydrogenase